MVNIFWRNMRYSFNFKTYEDYCQEVASAIKNMYNIDRAEEVVVTAGRNKVEMTISQYIFNLVLARVPIFYGNKKFVMYMDKNITSRKVNDYINKNILDRYMFDVDDVKGLKELIVLIIEDLILISAKTNTHSGNTVNIYDIIKEASKNKKLYNIMNTKLDAGLDVLEGEKILNDLTDDFKEMLSGFDNSLKIYIDSKVGIKDKQLRETFVNMGYVSSITGQILPRSINNSLLNGMDGPIDYYISAIGARKALVTNHNLVGKSGHFTRKSLLLLTDMDFSLEDDCESDIYVPVYVTNQRRLNALHGKHYKTRTGPLKVIDKKNNKLIGRVLQTRSPLTCRYAHTNRVCKKCFGELWRTSEDLHIGIMSVLFLTSNFTQALLSTKHLSRITIESVLWDDSTKMYFDIGKSSLTPKISDIEIHIDLNDLEDSKMGQGRLSSLTVVDGESEVLIKFPMPVFNDDIVALVKANDKVVLSGAEVKKLKFKYIIENSEFFKILDKTLMLVDNNSIHNRESYHDVLREFTDILDESNVNLNSSFSELFISNLIRNKENPHKKHNFHEEGEYGMVRLSTAIQHSSQLMGISFERIKTQFQDVKFYKNDNVSIIENFYK